MESQQWSHEFQRYLQPCWDEQHARYYWKHYVDGQWVFFGWVPVSAQASAQHSRMDSGHDHSQSHLHPGAHTAATSSARGRGFAILGTYIADNPQPDSHYEPLDPAFFVRSKDFFVRGRVFSVLFTEPLGTTATSQNDSVSYVKYGEQVYTQVRRFIVVRQRKSFCFAIPIFTYGKQGTRKPGVAPHEHAIAYSYGKEPSCLHGEQQLSKRPICVVMADGQQSLHVASRIFFGIHHPIQYNVKVKDLGYVHPNDLANLLGYWTAENQQFSGQAVEDTAIGMEED